MPEPVRHPPPEVGLSIAEAASRLARDGATDLAGSRHMGLGRIAWVVVRQPMFLLLLACSALYFALGDRGEAVFLLISVVAVVGLALFQQRRTQRALEALRDLASPRAQVLRDGVVMRIPGREVVVGDLLLLAEGDRVPADARLLDASALEIDESLVSGESLPVTRTGSRGDTTGDDVQSGTLVVRGRARALVTGTGANSTLGRIGSALGGIATPPTPLQRDTDRVVRRVATAALLASLLLAAIHVLSGRDWIDGVLGGLALAMSLLPEEFPVVMTVFLAIGAWRIARIGVLARSMPAVETLGAATVLCVDKTGTLTENRMRIAAFVMAQAPEVVLDPARDGSGPGAGVVELVQVARLASHRESFDPMERALFEFDPAGPEPAPSGSVRDYPLTPQLFALARAWPAPDGAVRVACKGAPEAVAALCRLAPDARRRIEAATAGLGARGARVLGVATAMHAGEPLPEQLGGYAFELVGLIAFADPLRAGVNEAVAECRAAGMRVIMATGDHVATARHIAQSAGLSAGVALTGAEIEGLDEAALGARLAGCDVVARVTPAHKLRIVRALQARGETVAMTGDGVNDAPALKAAEIGVAMGGRGTDVAREAAALVVTDDNFASIVAAVRLGRRIYDNLCKAVGYIVAVHLPIAGVAFVPVLFGWPLVLLPAHIAFLELIIDPACAIAFEAEPEEADLMRRPPRARADSPYRLRALLPSALLGLVALAACLAVMLYARAMALDAEATRAAVFTMLVLGNLALIGAHRTRIRHAAGNRNPALWWIVAGSLACLAAALYWPALGRLFRFASPAPQTWLAVALVLAALLLGFAVLARLGWRPAGTGAAFAARGSAR